MADPVRFARAMRARGFRYHRPQRGIMRFSGRFEGGFGVVQTYSTPAIAAVLLNVEGLAEHAFCQAKLSAGMPVGRAAA